MVNLMSLHIIFASHKINAFFSYTISIYIIKQKELENLCTCEVK